MKNIMIDGEVAFAAKQFDKERSYWINKLSQYPERADFPFDYPSNTGIEQKSVQMEQIRLPIELSEQLLKICNQSDTRLHVILVTGLVILLNKYTGSREIIVGTPIDRQETEGVFINTVLALRNRIYDSMSFKDLLMQVKQTTTEAREHMNYPLESTIFELGITETSANDRIFPLFSTAIMLENIHEKSYLEQVPLVMTWNFSRKESQVQGNVEYDPAFYSSKSIERIIDQYLLVLQQSFANVNILISDIDIISEVERQQLLIEFNNTNFPYPRNKTIIELFENQAARTPDNYAAKYEDNKLTYCELKQRIDHLANLLREKMAPQQVVALMGERNLEIIIGIIGILKAGGIYLPIDGHNPEERIKFILKDSNARVLLSQEPVIQRKAGSLLHLPQDKILALDKIFGEAKYPVTVMVSSQIPTAVRPSDIAYIIYTSGTTGKPRGVAVQHRALTNYTWWAASVYVREQSADFALYTSIGFDLTLTSIFTPLITGNAVTVYTGWDKEVLVERVVDDNQVSVIKITPSHLKLLRDKKIPSSNCCIKRFIVGGEELETGLAKAIHDNFQGSVEIYNEYGPTEATVGCMIHSYNHREDNGRTVPIGKPAANTQIYLLDGDGNPVPESGSGELFISGEGLALGYINRPELTFEKFINGNKYNTSTLYRTNDLARWLTNGNIEFLGRKDDQVKIRGFRIELGEIEQRLLEHQEVKEAVAISKKNEGGDNFLCAYVVCVGEISTAELREYLLNHLPDYMVPTFIMKVDSIPLTPNGKVNKRALPEPVIETEVQYVAPRNETEQKLAEIWSEVLKIDIKSIGIDANFFEQGGHSLSATLMLAKIKKVFNANLVLVEIFKNPTIRKLSEKLNESKEEKFFSINPQEDKEYYPLSSTQKRLYILQQVDTASTAFNITRIMILEGALEKEKLERTCQYLVNRHEGFRTSFLMIGDESVQRIHRTIALSVFYYTSDEKEAQKIISRFTKPFDLSLAPLLRVGVIRIGPDRHILMVEMHHIVADGISMALLVKDFITSYEGMVLPPLKLQYRDFSQWQNSDFEKERLKKEEEYWLSKLKGEIPVLNLPTDYPRPEIKNLEGKSINFELDKMNSSGLKKLAGEEEATIFMVLLAVFSIFLSKISGQEDILIGSPTAGRSHSDLENTIGDFINTIVLRTFPAGQKTFRKFLKEVREETLSVLMNQDYPFDNLVEKMGRQRDASRSPLFDVVLNFLYDETKFGEELQADLFSLKTKEYEYELKVSIHDLTLYPLDKGETILLALEYSTKLFDDQTVESFIKYMNEIVSLVIENPDIQLADIKLPGDFAYSETKISHEDLDGFGF